jgi:heme oxygenase
MDRLKEATAAAHARVDALMDLPAMTAPRYCAALAGLRDTHVIVERELLRHAPALAAFGYDVATRSKLPWLDADLAALGVALDAPSASLAMVLDDSAAAFGAIYVMEGSMFGGRIIARHMIPALGVTTSEGCRYFTGYGANTGNRWRETSISITRAAAALGEDGADKMLAAANNTFALVESALTGRLRA